MSTKKLSPGEELEKQYNDYKAQFEEWKERNKESVGTEAYVRYVKQFEDWERDVQKQRAMVRQKAEEEAHRKADAEKMARRRQEEAEAAAQRAAEQNRIANRQRRLVAAAAASTAAAAAAERQPQEAPQQPTPLHRQSSASSLHRVVQQSTPIQQSGGTPDDVSAEANPMANIVQQMMNFAEKQNGAEISQELQSAHQYSQNQQIMESHYYQHHKCSVHLSQPAQLAIQSMTARQPIVENESSIAVASTVSAPATVILQQQAPPVEAQSPPQLWGGEGASYAVTDPMFRRWNVRAAPPNFCVSYEPPPPNVTTNPYWMLVEKMREKKLVLAPSLKATITVPPPGAPVLNGAPGIEWSSPNKPPSLMSGPIVPPPAVGVPPPFRPSHAPPPFHTSPHFPSPHPAARPPPHMYNIPPPNFRLPPPTAAAGGPPPPYYNAK